MYVHVGLQLCGEGNLLLTDNATNGTIIIVSFVNTLNFSEVAQSRTFQGNYIPSSQLCGQFFERCDTSTITRGGQTVLIVPQIGGVGLLLRNGDSNDPQLYTLSPSNLEGCTFTYFVPIIASPHNEFMGYCFASGVLHTFTITVNFELLNLSTIEPRLFDDSQYSLGVSVTWSNFIHFDNYPPDSCFSTELPHAFFLVNNTLIHHSFGDMVYNPIGRINTESTCTKLQRTGECELAAYCGREVYTFSIHDNDRDNFAPNRLTADGGVFVCSSGYFISIRNNTLTLHNRETTSPVENTFINFDAENILHGKCHAYGSVIDSTSFIVSLQDTSGSWTLYTIQVTQDSGIIRPLSSGSTESNMITSRVGSQYAVVRNGTNTLIYNWTLTCEEKALSVRSRFVFVSFYSSNSMDQCRCPSNPISVPTTSNTSPTTIEPVMSQSPSISGVLINLGVAGFVLSCLIISIGIIVGIILFCVYVR